MKNTQNQNIFFFMPLASIGGTEMVHADILEALKSTNLKIFVRYRLNIWKDMFFVKTKEAKIEGKAMLPIFEQYGNVVFLSNWLEPIRFGRIIRFLYTKWLFWQINSKKDSIVLFWHRESIEFIFPHLKPHVKIIDIVHNNSNDQYPDAQYLVNDWVPRINKRVLISGGLLKWIDPLYAQSNFPEEYKKRISIIPHAVFIPEKALEKSNTPPIAIFVGRDSIEKRFHIIVDIAKWFYHQQIPLDFHFIGPQKDKYMDESTPNIHWHGAIADKGYIQQMYSKADFLLLTSSSEGFPKVIAEAMAFGCIPISTDVGGIKDVIESGVNGILTNPDNCMNETITALKTLLDNRELKGNISTHARETAKSMFNFHNFEVKWNQIINQWD